MAVMIRPCISAHEDENDDHDDDDGVDDHDDEVNDDNVGDDVDDDDDDLDEGGAHKALVLSRRLLWLKIFFKISKHLSAFFFLFFFYLTTFVEIEK